jgi:hypothetical protein
MTNPSFSLPPSDDALEELVNEVIDAESQGQDARALELIRKGVAEHPGFGARLAATRAAVRSLRQPVFVPDQRGAVLTETDFVRPFLSPRVRRQLSASRIAIAAGVVLTASLLTTLKYVYPEVDPTPSQPVAIGGVMEASRADAAASVRSLASVVEDLRHGMQAPVETVLGTTSPGFRLATEPLRLGQSSTYDPDLTIGSLARDRGSSTRWARRPHDTWIDGDGSDRSLAGTAADHPDRFALIADRPLRLLGNSLPRSASVRAVDLWEQLRVDPDGIVSFDAEPGDSPKSPEKAQDKK